MGFQKPSAFETVFDVKLEKGRVIEIKDRSEEIQRIRGGFARSFEKDPFSNIGKAFSRDMELE